MHNKKFCLIVWLCLVFLMAKSADAIVINEIMYDPYGTEKGKEWIELYNNEAETINLTGWTIDGKAIPETIIQPSEYLIIANNDTKFKEFYPNVNCDVVKVTISLKKPWRERTLMKKV